MLLLESSVYYKLRMVCRYVFINDDDILGKWGGGSVRKRR